MQSRYTLYLCVCTNNSTEFNFNNFEKYKFISFFPANFLQIIFCWTSIIGMVDTRCWIGLCVCVKEKPLWPIAGFGGSRFVFLAILSELTVQCVPYWYLQTGFVQITRALCLWHDQSHYCTDSGRRWQEFSGCI
jgi:hypothetical protein